VLAGALAATTSVATSGDAADAELLPDLYPWEPLGLVLATSDVEGTPHFRLGFTTQGNNIGDGPLIIRGSRPADVPTMTAEQIVARADGSTAAYPGVGTMQYTISADNGHMHWHLLRFMVYELRRVADYSLASPDQKTGFCLADRVALKGSTLPNIPPAAVYTGGCGWKQPELLALEEGISVGYGDPYAALLEGQSVDLTGLPDDYYYLIIRMNADGKLRETNLKNNASSLQLRITWPNGLAQEPLVDVVQSCPGRDRCLDELDLRVRSPARIGVEQKAITLGITLSRAATVRTSLLGGKGGALARGERTRLEAGTHRLRLALPSASRRPGRYKVRVAAAGAGVAPIVKTVPIRIG
jgi:hypothetical protein